ncbi:MAG: hypothetical protein QOG49_222 [Frankiaceae bacterium]|jgi:hypothetical protein|nr:hypothetical protein [Frankiaceae bacterium]
MRIDKAQVLDILRSLGKETAAAERELPDQVDTDTDSELLGKYGISGGDLLEQFGGANADRARDGVIDLDAHADGDVNAPLLPPGGLYGARGVGVQGGGAS